MTKFEKEVAKAETMGLKVVDGFNFSCPKIKGLIRNNVVLISSTVRTDAEKASVLFEEIAHYRVNTGDITDQDDANNRYQELKAHKRMVHDNLPLEKIVRAVIALGIDSTKQELAEALDVSENFLDEASTVYWREYGEIIELEGFIIRLKPFGIARKQAENSSGFEE